MGVRVSQRRAHGAVTFRADQDRPLAAFHPSKPSRAERIAVPVLLAILGGLGQALPWAPWVALFAAAALAALATRDMIARGRIGVWLSPFFGLTVAAGLSAFILAGYVAVGFLPGR